MTGTEPIKLIDARKLLILSAQADHLAQLRDRKRISEADYIERLNDLRREFGLPPVAKKSA